MLAEAYQHFYKIFEREMGDRSGTVGASEIGSCARQTFWHKFYNKPKGVEKDDDFEEDWGARIRGTIMEFAFWVPALRYKYGDKLLWAGLDQQKLVKGYLSATPDGLLTGLRSDHLRHLGVKNIKSDCITVECKTIDPRTNLVEAKETNIYQCTVQLGLMREFTPYKPVYGLLTYTDASFWSEVDEYPIEFDDFMYQAAHERAEEIMTAKNGSELLPEGWIAGGKECSFCPFTKACGVERRRVPHGSKKADPQFAAEIEDMAKKYNQVKLSGMRLDADMKKMEIEIKDRLRDKRVRRIPNVVNWYEVKAPVRYKNKDIREEFVSLGGDPDDYMTIGEPSDRLVVAATPVASRVVKAGRQSAKVKAKTKTETKAPKRAKTKTANKTKAKSKVKVKTQKGKLDVKKQKRRPNKRTGKH